MSDNKKYYYMKLVENFFDTPKIKILEGMGKKGVYYSNLLLKLYLISLKTNGALRLNEKVAYDEKMLADLTRLNIKIVREGLAELTAMKLIEILEDGTIYMTDIQSLIGHASSEAERKSIYRKRIEEEKRRASIMSQECPNENETCDGTFACLQRPLTNCSTN